MWDKKKYGSACCYVGLKGCRAFSRTVSLSPTYWAVLFFRSGFRSPVQVYNPRESTGSRVDHGHSGQSLWFHQARRVSEASQMRRSVGNTRLFLMQAAQSRSSQAGSHWNYGCDTKYTNYMKTTCTQSTDLFLFIILLIWVCTITLPES